MPIQPGQGGHRPEYKRPREKTQRENALSRDPNYGTHLPKTFPYRWVGSIEDAGTYLSLLFNAGRSGYALTSHTAAIDGHVYLWLSVSAAEFLVEMRYLSRESLERTFH